MACAAARNGMESTAVVVTPVAEVECGQLDGSSPSVSSSSRSGRACSLSPSGRTTSAHSSVRLLIQKASRGAFWLRVQKKGVSRVGNTPNNTNAVLRLMLRQLRRSATRALSTECTSPPPPLSWLPRLLGGTARVPSPFRRQCLDETPPARVGPREETVAILRQDQ